MSGYTVLNIEKIFNENAQIEYERAINLMEIVYIDDYDKSTKFKSCGRNNKECIKASILCLFSFALTLELNINLVIEEKNYEINRYLGIQKKINEILKKLDYKTRKKFPLEQLKKLFKIRNKYMHYDYEKIYIGSSFAEDYQIDLSFENLKMFNNLVQDCQLFFKDNYLISGDYEAMSDGIITQVY